MEWNMHTLGSLSLSRYTQYSKEARQQLIKIIPLLWSWTCELATPAYPLRWNKPYTIWKQLLSCNLAIAY